MVPTAWMMVPPVPGGCPSPIASRCSCRRSSRAPCRVPRPRPRSRSWSPRPRWARGLISVSVQPHMEPRAPAPMSLTKRLPAAVPSLTHGSTPWTPSSATKKAFAPTLTMPVGSELSVAVSRSVTRCVPSAWPSLTQSSRPWTRSSALKNSCVPTAVSHRGEPPQRMTRGRDVGHLLRARRGAVAAPQLVAVGFLRAEVQPPVHGGGGGFLVPVVGRDLARDRLGASRRAVGAPQSPSMGAIVRGEEQPAADSDEVLGSGAAARSDVPDHACPTGGAVAHPQLLTMGRVAGQEVDDVPTGTSPLTKVRPKGVDVRDTSRAGRRPVADPELPALRRVWLDHQVGPVAGGDQLVDARVAGRVDVLHAGGTTRVAVRGPQVAAMREQQPPADRDLDRHPGR